MLSPVFRYVAKLSPGRYLPWYALPYQQVAWWFSGSWQQAISQMKNNKTKPLQEIKHPLSFSGTLEKTFQSSATGEDSPDICPQKQDAQSLANAKEPITLALRPPRLITSSASCQLFPSWVAASSLDAGRTVWACPWLCFFWAFLLAIIRVIIDCSLISLTPGSSLAPEQDKVRKPSTQVGSWRRFRAWFLSMCFQGGGGGKEEGGEEERWEEMYDCSVNEVSEALLLNKVGHVL